MIKNILIVDDSPMIHKLLRKILVKNDYEVVGDASNGHQGVEMYSELQPDLVFMDITMPILNGIDAATKIKDMDCNANIIMLSAMSDDEIKEEAKQIGIDIFLNKPFNEFKIISAIAKI